jgi:hypothetical protein
MGQQYLVEELAGGGGILDEAHEGRRGRCGGSPPRGGTLHLCNLATTPAEARQVVPNQRQINLFTTAKKILEKWTKLSA